MKTQLTTEQSDALHRSSEPLSLMDPKTGKVYVLMDVLVYQQAMSALQWQRGEYTLALQQGLGDMHAGRGMTLDESRTRTSEALARLSR